MAESKKLIILQMNDSHTYLEMHSKMFVENGIETYLTYTKNENKKADIIMVRYYAK